MRATLCALILCVTGALLGGCASFVPPATHFSEGVRDIPETANAVVLNVYFMDGSSFITDPIAKKEPLSDKEKKVVRGSSKAYTDVLRTHSIAVAPPATPNIPEVRVYIYWELAFPINYYLETAEVWVNGTRVVADHYCALSSTFGSCEKTHRPVDHMLPYAYAGCGLCDVGITAEAMSRTLAEKTVHWFR